MKKTLAIISIILLIGYVAVTGQNDNQLKTTSELVKIISSDTFEGRAPGTVGIEKATLFVENYYRLLGIKPFFNHSYRDTLSAYGIETYNIVGVIDSENSRDEYILIGAHLDHLGKSKAQADSIYNGANDNASGVTAVLQIARELRKHKFDKKVLIVIFTAEEWRLKGSKHLAQKLKMENIQLSYVINFDMIGTALTESPGKVYITGYNKSNFANASNKMLDEEFILYEQIATDYGLFRVADNYPFYTVYNIPSHTISTYNLKNFDYLHDVRDDFPELDIENMDTIISKTTQLIVRLLKNDVEVKLNQ